jgi:glyoxylase-like metal-dependent hydrolase (beta-lactamase superfamily II)
MAPVTIVPIPVKMGPMTVMAYLLVGDRVVVLDTGVPGQEKRILHAIEDAGHTASDVSLILLTHGHGDHAGSADALRAATAAPIALGAGDEEKCALGRDTEMRGRGLTGAAMLRLLRHRQAGSNAVAGPCHDIVISSELSLLEYGVDAVVVPTPGHSRGSLSVFTADGDALVGDLLGGGGRSRKGPQPGIFMSDEAVMDESIRGVLRRRPRLTYTGHDLQPFTFEQLTQAFGTG